MKPDNFRKKERQYKDAVKEAEKRRKNGFLEGATLAYLKAVNLLPQDKYPEQIGGCFYNIGLIYLDSGQYDLAEDYLQRALVIDENIREFSLSTADALNLLGIVYDAKNDVQKAVKCYERALKIREGLGAEDTGIATSLNNLGSIYHDKKEFDQAEKAYKRALDTRLKVFGNSHPATASTFNNLGCLYEDRGELDKASKYFQYAKEALDAFYLQDNHLVNEALETFRIPGGYPIKEIITENHNKLQEQLIRLEHEKLEIRAALYQSKKLEYLGQMATLMAHNINQPIAVLRMAASGALSDVNENLFKPETELKPLLEKLLAQTERLSDMMGNFRHFARGDRTVLSAVNLNTVIEAIYQLLFVAQYQLEQIDLQKEFSASPIAHANEWALQEMLISLLSNARAAVKDKAQKQVAIRTWQQDQQVGFCIEDSGDGIAAENLPKLFTPFLSSKEEGMGLGLYFCRQIAHDLGGSIDYYPSPLGGAGFKITLPAQQE